MSETPSPPGGSDIERIALGTYSERAYLDYAMYVINDRALPQIGDGLKPVQRRIIYAMSELGLDATAKHAKSARTVGDVLGKFHPHGDSACYEAMVLMAQPFSYRYPLIDGQGNWGAPDDPRSFAAMRYTEARLTRHAALLLDELDQGTVDFAPNFDGTLDEPVLLPARLPFVLLNGSMGIAVGMATDIPPHNLNEVAAACIRLLDQPDADSATLCEHILGPDFPTAAPLITPRDELVRIYTEGRGTLRARAGYAIEDGEIVITALPHQTSGSRVLEQIAQQMQQKKLPMVVDLRDEGDHECPVRIVVVPRSNRVDLDRLMNHLYATTELERTFRVNLNILGRDGRPKVQGLAGLLGEWLEFRRATVRRRLEFRLARIDARLHILEGLLIAFLNLDEVIRIVREEDHPRDELMRRFGLSELQATAILDLRLRQLARLEEQRIRGERDELAAERSGIVAILESPARMTALLRDELAADAAKYGDARRTPLEAAAVEARAYAEEELLSSEPLTVILSQMGWVRAAKGHDIDAAELPFRTGDGFLSAVRGRSNQALVFIDSTGRSYALAPHTLPSARGQGEPLSGRTSPPSGAQFVGAVFGDPADRFVLATDAGYGFIVRLEQLVARNRAGKAVLTVPDGAQVMAPLPVPGGDDLLLAVATTAGRLLLFAVAELPELARGKGNRLIQIPATDLAARTEVVAGIAVLAPDRELLVHAGARHLRMRARDLEHYRGERARRGRMLPRGFQKVDRLAVE